MKVKEFLKQHSDVLEKLNNSEDINDLMMLKTAIMSTVEKTILNNERRDTIMKYLENMAEELLEKEI